MQFCKISFAQRFEAKIGEINYLISETVSVKSYNNMTEQFETKEKVNSSNPILFNRTTILKSLYSDINYFVNGVPKKIKAFTLAINCDDHAMDITKTYNSNKIATNDTALINKIIKANKVVVIYYDEILLEDDRYAPGFMFKIDKNQ